MKGFSIWKFGVIISCSVTMGMIIIFWDKIETSLVKNNSRKKTDCSENINNSLSEEKRDVMSGKILQLPYPRWKKVGKVKELYFYPLKSGRGKSLSECQFTEFGIAVIKNGCHTLRDRMILIYNVETGKFITGRNYPTLILVSLSAVNEFNVKLEATGMSSLIFHIPSQSDKILPNVNCLMWWGEQIKCIDCGDEPAKWISKFLTGTDCGLRVGLAPLDKRNILRSPWEKFTKIYNNLTNDDVGLFSDIASYMLIAESSLVELNKKLKNPIPSLQIRPNIVIADTEPFSEDNWEWIKIGESTVIRNVKPCPRCSMIRINPETGVVDDEPLQSLKTFRKQTDKERIAVDGKAPILGIYCGLYTVGNVKINDDVFVHLSQTVRTTKL